MPKPLETAKLVAQVLRGKIVRCPNAGSQGCIHDVPCPTCGADVGIYCNYDALTPACVARSHAHNKARGEHGE
jgi:hypothetical protein